MFSSKHLRQSAEKDQRCRVCQIVLHVNSLAFRLGTICVMSLHGAFFPGIIRPSLGSRDLPVCGKLPTGNPRPSPNNYPLFAFIIYGTVETQFGIVVRWPEFGFEAEHLPRETPYRNVYKSATLTSKPSHRSVAF